MAQIPAVTPDVDKWQAGQLELVVFPLDWAATLEQNWWNELTGADPESTRKRHERVDSGIFRGAHFRFATNPLRTAWTVAPQITASLEQGISGAPTIGKFADAIAWFAPLMRDWIAQSCPAIKRMGFTATAIWLCDTREDAYRVLDAHLHSVDVDVDSRELMYRINRPRQSKIGIPELEINRMSTWASIILAMQFNATQMVGPQMDPRSLPLISDKFQACVLNIDVNSSQDRTAELPRERLTDLWNELVGLGTEIAGNGDTK